jgi:hypothetical protein
MSRQVKPHRERACEHSWFIGSFSAEVVKTLYGYRAGPMSHLISPHTLAGPPDLIPYLFVRHHTINALFSTSRLRRTMRKEEALP